MYKLLTLRSSCFSAGPYNLGTIKITLRPLGDERNEASQKVLGKGAPELYYLGVLGIYLYYSSNPLYSTYSPPYRLIGSKSGNTKTDRGPSGEPYEA